MVTQPAMVRMSRSSGIVWGAALALSLLAVGCKQGVGGRCEVNSDCTSGLLCNGNTQDKVCTVNGGTAPLPPVDAALLPPATSPPDAAAAEVGHPVDVAPAEAGTDGPLTD